MATCFSLIVAVFWTLPIDLSIHLTSTVIYWCHQTSSTPSQMQPKYHAENWTKLMKTYWINLSTIIRLTITLKSWKKRERIFRRSDVFSRPVKDMTGYSKGEFEFNFKSWRQFVQKEYRNRPWHIRKFCINALMNGRKVKLSKFQRIISTAILFFVCL